MKKTTATILTSLLITTTGVLVGASIASAQSIEVGFGSEPLFNDLNLAPGKSVTRFMDITNLGTKTREVLLSGTTTDACSDVCIADKLVFDVSNATSTLLHDTLSDFLSTTTEITLGNITSSSTEHYNLTITLDLTAGNRYQGLTTSFDVITGFSTSTIDDGGTDGGSGGGDGSGGDGGNGGGTDGSGGGNGGSGGGGGGIGGSQEDLVISGGGGNGPIATGEKLILSNERITSLNLAAGTATIMWLTNRPATSQVIFGDASGGPYSINLTLPHYGYAHSSSENYNKTLVHMVTIDGLHESGIYSYRVISRASSPTISQEHRFVFSKNGALEIVSGTPNAGGMGGTSDGILPEGGEEGADTTLAQGNDANGSSGSEMGTGAVVGALETTPIENGTTSSEVATTTTGGGILGGLAVAFFAIGQLPHWILWLIILLALLVILYLTRKHWQPYLIGKDIDDQKKDRS